MPRPELAEALKRFLVASDMKKVGNKFPFVSIMGPSVQDVEIVVGAARGVLEGQPIWWCLTHLDTGPDVSGQGVYCHAGMEYGYASEGTPQHRNHIAECRMVQRTLINQGDE